MLHLVVGGREDLTQQLFQPHFADRAAQLRDLEQLLHLGHRGAHRLEAFRRLTERPESLVHIAQRSGLVRAAPQQQQREQHDEHDDRDRDRRRHATPTRSWSR